MCKCSTGAHTVWKGERNAYLQGFDNHQIVWSISNISLDRKLVQGSRPDYYPSIAMHACPIATSTTTCNAKKLITLRLESEIVVIFTPI